jgi:hypothetical protein
MGEQEVGRKEDQCLPFIAFASTHQVFCGSRQINAAKMMLPATLLPHTWLMYMRGDTRPTVSLCHFEPIFSFSLPNYTRKKNGLILYE